MARFQERPQQLRAQLDTGGADVARNLAAKLADFSQRAGGVRAEQVERESLQAGFEAGLEKQQPTKNELSIASKAFNRGLRASYIAESQTDIRDNIARIAEKNAMNPQGFENDVKAWEMETLKNIDDLELRTSLQDSIRSRAEPTLNSIATAKRDRIQAENKVKINNEIDALNIEAQTAARDGDLLEGATKLGESFLLIDEKVESGLMDFESGAKQKEELERDWRIERVRGETIRDFENLDSFGKAMQRLEEKEIPGFDAKETIIVKAQIEADLRASIDRQQLNEANQAELSNEEQQANYDKLRLDQINGTLTVPDMMRAINRGDISADQGIKLADSVGKRGRGVDNFTTENQLELMLTNGEFAQAKEVIDANWGSNLTDETARKYLNRITEQESEESLLNTPEAKRYKRNLETFIGYSDSLTSIVNPEIQQQWGRAILEYENAVLAGADPQQTMFRVVNDFTNPEQRFNSMRNPRFSNNKDDIKQSVINTQRAFENDQLTESEYNNEINYIKNQLQPAFEAKEAWRDVLSSNSQQTKAEGE